MNFSHLDITKRIKESILSIDASAEGHLLREPRYRTFLKYLD